MKTSPRPKANPLFAIFFLAVSAFGGQDAFLAGTNRVYVVFQDETASDDSKNLFLEDFARAAAASENGLSIVVTTNECHPALRPVGPLESIRLDGLETPKFTNGGIGMPRSLVWTNGMWTLPVPKSCTDGYAALFTFAAAHSNELAQLRAFVANDLAAERLAVLSDEDVYEMYLSKQWAPGDRIGPARLDPDDRPQIIRGTYYDPPVAAVLSWPMGPDDAAEHLWAQISVRRGTNIFEMRAIYWRDQWWLTLWEFEPGEPLWIVQENE